MNNKHRTRFQNELNRFIMEDAPELLVVTSGNNQGWDNIIINGRGEFSNCVFIEVKSTVKKVKYLKATKETLEQYNWYKSLAEKYDIQVFYAFRYVSHDQTEARYKWRFYPINQIKDHKLRFNDGILYREFLHRITSNNGGQT